MESEHLRVYHWKHSDSRRPDPWCVRPSCLWRGKNKSVSCGSIQRWSDKKGLGTVGVEPWSKVYWWKNSKTAASSTSCACHTGRIRMAGKSEELLCVRIWEQGLCSRLSSVVLLGMYAHVMLSLQLCVILVANSDEINQGLICWNICVHLSKVVPLPAAT